MQPCELFKLLVLFFLDRLIKMSSPNLNNVIILGCILSYASVILFAFDGDYLTAYLCKASCLLSLFHYSTVFLEVKKYSAH